MSNVQRKMLQCHFYTKFGSVKILWPWLMFWSVDPWVQSLDSNVTILEIILDEWSIYRRVQDIVHFACERFPNHTYGTLFNDWKVSYKSDRGISLTTKVSYILNTTCELIPLLKGFIKMMTSTQKNILFSMPSLQWTTLGNYIFIWKEFGIHLSLVFSNHSDFRPARSLESHFESLLSHFDFRKNAWKSGWLTINNEFWVKSNSEDFQFYPILCMFYR